MVDPLTLAAFVPAALALNLTPGADMMFCMAQGVRSGPRAAWAASAGVSAGSMVHVTVAGLGLGAVMAAHPAAFDAIRWIGVAYLLWLAVGALRGSAAPVAASPVPAGRAFAQGFAVNISNPKVILFVLAFLPQFVRPEAGPVLGQFLLLGAVIAAGGLAVNGLAGVFAGGLGARLARGGRALGWISGGIFAALALRLALMERA